MDAKYFEDILKNYENSTQFVTMLRIIDDAMSFEPYKNWDAPTRDKLLDYVYEYYMEHDNCGLSQNYSTFDVVCWTMYEFAEEFPTMSYEEFERAIEGEADNCDCY